MWNSRALHHVLPLMTLVIIPASAHDIPQREQDLNRCILHALNDLGWPPEGQFKPWGAHERIKFTYVDKNGHRSNKQTYIFNNMISGDLLFGMTLLSDDDSKVASAIEQRCNTQFSAMFH